MRPWILIAVVVATVCLQADQGPRIGARVRGVGGGGGSSPISENCHPRAVISCGTTENVTTLRAVWGTGGALDGHLENVITYADARIGDTVTAYNAADARDFGLMYAVVCASYGTGTTAVTGTTPANAKSDYCTRARDLLISNIVALVNPDDYIQDYGFMVPLILDWAWASFSTADKCAYAAWIQAKSVPNTTHPFSSQFAVGRSMDIISGLVLQGAGIDGTCAGTETWAVNNGVGDGDSGYATWWDSQRGVMRAESDMAGNDGLYKESFGYYTAYSAHPMAVVTESYRTAAGISKAVFYANANTSIVKTAPTWVMHHIRPYAKANGSYPDGRMWRGHFTYYGGSADGQGVFWIDERFRSWMYMLGVQVTGVDNDEAALANWIYLNRFGAIASNTQNFAVRRFWPLMLAMTTQAMPTAVSPATLGRPLNRVRKNGYIEFRTGWTALTDTMVKIESDEWVGGNGVEWGNHPGSYSIDRNGPAVLLMGRAGSGRDMASQSWAGNVLAAVDDTYTTLPNGTFPEGGFKFSYVGTQTGSDNYYESDGTTKKDGTGFDRRNTLQTRLSAASGQKIHYVYMDHSLAYDTSAVSSAIRRMAYCEPTTPATSPAVLLVFDRMVTTDTKFEKRNLFWPAGDPVVSGSETAGTPSRGGTTTGKWTYTSVTSVRADHNNASSGASNTTYFTPLAPTSSVIKVGGPNTPTQHHASTASTSTTIALNASESSTDSIFVGKAIRITSGTGAGQAWRFVSAYNGTTKVATVSPAWSVTPDSTSYYAVSFTENGASASLSNKSREMEGLYGDVGLLFGDRKYNIDHPPGSEEEVPYLGEYRLEMIPTVDATTDHFLYTVETVPYNDAKSTTTLLGGMTNAIGATVGTCGYVAGTGATQTVSTMAFRLASTGTYRILVDWLTPSTSFTVRRKSGTNITSVAGIDPTVSSGTSITVTSTAEGTMLLEIVIGTGGSGDDNIVEIL